jgi:hypothetical protein
MYKKYNCEYPDLYSIAINSILGTRGYVISGVIHPARVKPIEKDSLGRVMFLYWENSDISHFSLIISQKTDWENGYAYYYRDYNFISIAESSHSKTIYSLSAFRSAVERFSDNEIEKLKRKNDWNMNIDLNRCEKVKIVRQKAEGPVGDRQVREFHRKVLGDDARRNNFTVFFVRDNYSRSMYVGMGWRNLSRRYDVLFFQPDGSYDEKTGVMELTDLNNYQDDLRAFKERNNWNVKP